MRIEVISRPSMPWNSMKFRRIRRLRPMQHQRDTRDFVRGNWASRLSTTPVLEGPRWTTKKSIVLVAIFGNGRAQVRPHPQMFVDSMDTPPQSRYRRAAQTNGGSPDVHDRLFIQTARAPFQ